MLGLMNLLPLASEMSGYLFPNLRVAVSFTYHPNLKVDICKPNLQLMPTFVPDLRVDVHLQTQPPS